MASDDTPVVAVLGTGIMGAAMARRWAEHGFPVTVWTETGRKPKRSPTRAPPSPTRQRMP